MPRPILFLLPAPDASARRWDGVIAALEGRVELVALDPAEAGRTVEETAERVAGQVRDREPDRWLLAGQGTGATVAALVAAWAERGDRGLIAPAGVVLVDPDDAALPDPSLAGRTRTVVIDGDLLRAHPREVARSILEVVDEARGSAVVPPAFARLIASDRVSARTRRVMLARLDEPTDAPRALSPAQHALLTAVLARVVPQPVAHIDLAGRIDADLAAGRGDGWRFADLPPDPEAWRRGLDTVAAAFPTFASLDAAAQDAAIDRVAAGEVGSDAADRLPGAAMALWFQDVQAAAVRTWLSHPAAQAWLRYDGFADGGDGPRKQGFTTTRAGEWEQWQRDWRTGEELHA